MLRRLVILKTFGTLLVLLALGLPLRAQNLTPEQDKAVQKVIIFYNQMGDKETAKRLQDGLKDGTVKFGPTPAMPTPHVICPARRININPSSVEEDEFSESGIVAGHGQFGGHHLPIRSSIKIRIPGPGEARFGRKLPATGTPASNKPGGVEMQKMVTWIRQVQGELDYQREPQRPRAG